MDTNVIVMCKLININTMNYIIKQLFCFVLAVGKDCRKASEEGQNKVDIFNNGFPFNLTNLSLAEILTDFLSTAQSLLY